MQDLPPPSYDDAISGAYPSNQKQEEQELNTFSPSAPQSEPYTPQFEPPPSPEPQIRNLRTTSKKKKCIRLVICILLVVVVIAVMATVVKDIIPSPITNCKKSPIARKARFNAKIQGCQQNYRGEYSAGTSCVYECTEPYHVIHKYKYGPRPLEGDLRQLNYTCVNSKWIPSVGSSGDSFWCKERPTRPEDCKTEPPISVRGLQDGTTNFDEVKWVECERNGHGQYFDGTECRFMCREDNNSLFVYGSDQILDYMEESEFSYQCNYSKWVPSFRNKKFQCVPRSSHSDDCTTKPTKIIPGAVIIDCPRRSSYSSNFSNRYPYGTKCTYACGYISRGGSEMFIETESGTISYTCNTSKWVSSVGEVKENWQCLSQPLQKYDCVNKPNVTGAYWVDCPKNPRGQYFDGTRCSFRCSEDNVVSSLEGIPGDVYRNGGSFVCRKAKWVSSAGENNENIECVPKTM